MRRGESHFSRKVFPNLGIGNGIHLVLAASVPEMAIPTLKSRPNREFSRALSLLLFLNELSGDVRRRALKSPAKVSKPSNVDFRTCQEIFLYEFQFFGMFLVATQQWF